MNSGKRYSDAEVHAIFKRAALRQEEATRAEDASRSGLSLAELQGIGAEAGINPTHIALAANELAVGLPIAGKGVADAFMGFPTRLGTSRRIRGKVDNDAWEQIVLQLRGIFGRDGIAGELGSIREWTVTSQVGNFDRPVKVTLKPDGNDTLVSIDQEMKGQAVGFSIGSAIYAVMGVMMVLVSLLATGGDPPPLGVGLLFLGLSVLFYGGSSFGTRLYAKRQLLKFERALDCIELVARAELPATSHREDVRPQTDLDALPDAADSIAEPPASRQREHE